MRGLVLLFLSPAEHQPEACAEEEAQAGCGVDHRTGPAGGGEGDAGLVLYRYARRRTGSLLRKRHHVIGVGVRDVTITIRRPSSHRHSPIHVDREVNLAGGNDVARRRFRLTQLVIAGEEVCNGDFTSITYREGARLLVRLCTLSELVILKHRVGSIDAPGQLELCAGQLCTRPLLHLDDLEGAGLRHIGIDQGEGSTGIGCAGQVITSHRILGYGIGDGGAGCVVVRQIAPAYRPAVVAVGRLAGRYFRSIRPQVEGDRGGMLAGIRALPIFMRRNGGGGQGIGNGQGAGAAVAIHRARDRYRGAAGHASFRDGGDVVNILVALTIRFFQTAHRGSPAVAAVQGDGLGPCRGIRLRGVTGRCSRRDAGGDQGGRG